MMSVELTDPDQFGQRHPVETPELLQEKLKELEQEVNAIDISEKDAYEQAKIKCPDQATNDSFQLLFLRCEVFNAKKAAQRMIKYWNKRLHLFGPDKAFLPPTLSGLFSDNEHGMTLGVSTVLPNVTDPSGRAILLYDPSRQDNSTAATRWAMIQALWYCIHAALLDPSTTTTQKFGMIGLVCPRYATLAQFDPRVDQLVLESVQGILPIRISCIVVCHAPFVFGSIIWPMVQLFLSQRILQRVRITTGSDPDLVVQQVVQAIGLTPDTIPQLIGGNLQVDHKAWIESRHKAGK